MVSHGYMEYGLKVKQNANGKNRLYTFNGGIE